MNNINYFKDLCESIPVYKKIVLLMFFQLKTMLILYLNVDF